MTISVDDERTLTPASSTRGSATESPAGLVPISCVYCWEPIPAESFIYWSEAKRMVSAACPCCDRRVTLSAAMWRHWSGMAQQAPGGESGTNGPRHGVDG